MLNRYRIYRSYGHGRFIAATLAPHPIWFPVAGVLVGATFSWWFQ